MQPHQDVTELGRLLQGVTDPVVRNAALMADARQIYLASTAAGIDPAAATYSLAKTVGYRSGTPAAAPAARIASAAEGQHRNGGGLSSVRGSGPAPLTVQRLIEMSEAEFARAIATPEGRALLGT